MGRYREKGFTLVEILVTLAMMGVIMAALYGSYQAVARAREALGPSYSQTQRVVWMLDRMNSALHGAYTKPLDLSIKTNAVIRDVNEGIQPSGDFVGVSKASRTDLTFVRVMMSPDADECSLQRVYVRWIRSDRILQMATTSAFYLPEPDLEDALDWQPLLDSVESFEVTFLSGGQWHDTWPQEEVKSLPEAIRISVTVHTEDELPRCWTTTVSPALSRRSSDRIEESL